MIGVRNAFERRGGGASSRSVPPCSARSSPSSPFAGLAVFGASLSHLTATPRLYGDAFQLNFTDRGRPGRTPLCSGDLSTTRPSSGITEGSAVEISVDKLAVGAVAASPSEEGSCFRPSTGHVPIGDRADRPRRCDDAPSSGRIWDRSSTSLSRRHRVETRTRAFQVVWQISFPVLGGAVGLGSGAALTMAGYEAAVCPVAPSRPACLRALQSGPIGGGLLVSVVPGPRGERGQLLPQAYRSIVALPVTPTSLVNFGEAVNFPLIFGGDVGRVRGGHTRPSAGGERLARTAGDGASEVLGFVNRQIAATVAWQATALALVGIVVGVPLGTVLGAGGVGRVRQQPRSRAGLGGTALAALAAIVLGILVGGQLCWRWRRHLRHDGPGHNSFCGPSEHCGAGTGVLSDRLTRPRTGPLYGLDLTRHRHPRC